MRILFSILLLLLAQHLFAHPVTYKNAIASSITFNENTDFYINYSNSSKSSYGLRYYQLPNQNQANFYFIQRNYLIKRWHFTDAQANIYSTQAIAYTPQNKYISPCFKLVLDIENRRYLSSLQTEFMQPSTTSFFTLQSRIGFAPYKHSFTGIATWFMLQFNHTSYKTTSTTLMPLYRGFINNILWELGYNGSTYFYQLMIHI